MPKSTPKLGLTVPDINDPIAAWAEIAEQGLLDLENSSIIGLKNAADSHDTYPIGMSMFGVTSSGATDNGWPSGSGMIISWRRPLADITFQIKVSQGVAKSPLVYGRTGGNSGWSPWGLILSNAATFTAEAAGAVTGQVTAPDRYLSVPVVFPADRFTVAPRITMSVVNTNYPDRISVTANNITASGFVALFHRSDSDSAVTAHWHASEGA